MKPQKIFGFIYFQRKYDGVVLEVSDEQILKEYVKQRTLYINLVKKETSHYTKMKLAEWNLIKTRMEDEFDKINKSQMLQLIKEKMQRELKQVYGDLPATLNDAKQMLTFLDDFIVKNFCDITIMCNLRDLPLIL